jgi:hypothetical protein
MSSEPLSHEFLVSCGISLGIEKVFETENVVIYFWQVGKA